MADDWYNAHLNSDFLRDEQIKKKIVVDLAGFKTQVPLLSLKVWHQYAHTLL